MLQALPLHEKNVAYEPVTITGTADVYEIVN